MLGRLLALALVLAAAQSSQVGERPRLAGCTPRAFAGKSICVCGAFPGSSGERLLLDGRPLGPPAGASAHSVTLVLPDTLSPGMHVVTGAPEAGFSASESVVVLVLGLVAEIDATALVRSQRTRARFAVVGTTSRVSLRIVNRTPEVVAVEGGVDQIVLTAGGTANAVTRSVRARSRGDFQIDANLADDPCPCGRAAEAGRLGAAPAPPQPPQPPAAIDPRGFLAARVLAAIPLAAPGAMTATAQALSARHGLALAGVTPLGGVGYGLVVLLVPAGSDVLASVAAVSASPEILFAEPDYLYDTTVMQDTGGLALKYGPKLIGVTELAPSVTGRDVKVAVIDTGADADHPALRGRLVDKADVTGTKYQPGIHGTFVAGIIADLAPRAAILAIQACLPHSPEAVAARCSAATLAQALDRAILARARIINLSLGGPHSLLLQRLIEHAIGTGAVVVAAAGNGGPGASPPFPAALESVIAVTAVDAAQAIFAHATRGRFVDLAAPGVDIVGPGPGGTLVVLSGTSAAAPHVSAVVALMLQVERSLPASEVQPRLERSARALGPPERAEDFGHGLVDACRAIQALPAGARLCSGLSRERLTQKTPPM